MLQLSAGHQTVASLLKFITKPNLETGVSNDDLSFLAVFLPLVPSAAGAPSVVIDVLWRKVATKVGTFLAKSMNLVHTFPHGPQIVKL
jgi:hypothetical protein